MCARYLDENFDQQDWIGENYHHESVEDSRRKEVYQDGQISQGKFEAVVTSSQMERSADLCFHRPYLVPYEKDLHVGRYTTFRRVDWWTMVHG